MVKAKLLRKKLKNGLIVDKWDLVTIIEKQQAEIEALKYEKSSGVYDAEPVAWMNKLGRLEYEQGNGFEIPLYTHPIKELTNEEIIEVWDKMCSIVLDNDKNITEFARAILRKAQEK